LHFLNRWGNVAQIGYVVKNLQKTIEVYWHKYGIGPWHIYDCTYPEHQNTYVRGEPKSYSMRIAFTHLGIMELELIQPLSGDSIYREFLDSGREGIHHIGMKEVDGQSAIERLKAQGVQVLQTGTLNHGKRRYIYMDTEGDLGVILEYFEIEEGSVRRPPDQIYP
jgi:methylmalonyl-CoA/ethylmalonyl-CoA epimerase